MFQLCQRRGADFFETLQVVAGKVQMCEVGQPGELWRQLRQLVAAHVQVFESSDVHEVVVMDGAQVVVGDVQVFQGESGDLVVVGGDKTCGIGENIG